MTLCMARMTVTNETLPRGFYSFWHQQGEQKIDVQARELDMIKLTRLDFLKLIYSLAIELPLIW